MNILPDLSQPSTWVGIIEMIASLTGISVAPQVENMLAMGIVALVGIFNIWRDEKKGSAPVVIKTKANPAPAAPVDYSTSRGENR